jgi:hypothetical protein
MARKKKLKINSLVRFDPTTLNKEYQSGPSYDTFYKLHEGKTYIYLGDIVQAPGHCILADMDTGKIEAWYHADNFKELTEDEV